MFDFDEIETDVKNRGGDAWKEVGKDSDALGATLSANFAKQTERGGAPTGVLPPAPIPSGAAFAHRRPGALPIGMNKKVIIRNVKTEPEINDKVGEIMGFEDGVYSVKVMNMSGLGGYVPGAAMNQGSHMKSLPAEQLELHPDQVEKDRQVAEDGAIVLLGGDEAERAAREALYSLRLDPQHYYDKAVERVLEARNEFAVLNLETKWYGSDMNPIKRAYRKISVGIHPDKNKHPQAADCFRKVYGAFETLMDKKQQWRILFVLGKLKEEEVDLFELEAEEDERFEWWLDANIPEIEKQAAEIEGGEFEEIGEKWISDGSGGSINDVKWVGMSEGLRLHQEDKAIFIDCRERFEFEIEHIEGAYNIPMREFVDFGLAGVAGDWVGQVLRRKGQPVIIYSEVATPFSRCRAMCRWLLRAGSKSLPADRLRRLRGGMFGWRHKKGKVLLAIKDITPEQKAALHKATPKQIGALTPTAPAGLNLRVRVLWFDPNSTTAQVHDSSGGVWAQLTTPEQIGVMAEAAPRQGSLLLKNAEVSLRDSHLWVILGPDARIEKSDREFTFGFEAKNISEEVRTLEEEGGAEY